MHVVNPDLYVAQLVINRTVSHTLCVTSLGLPRALGGLDAYRVLDVDVTIGQTTLVLRGQVTLLHPAIQCWFGNIEKHSHLRHAMRLAKNW